MYFKWAKWNKEKNEKKKKKIEGIHLVQLHSVWCYLYYKVLIVYLKIVCKKKLLISLKLL